MRPDSKFCNHRVSNQYRMADSHHQSWFGLFHVFNDYINQVCEEPGDYVADTPMQASPSFGCPVGKDSCTEPGLDSIHNYMDYSDDPCYEEFTPLQAKRMYTFWFNYRDIKRKGTWWD